MATATSRADSSILSEYCLVIVVVMARGIVLEAGTQNGFSSYKKVQYCFETQVKLSKTTFDGEALLLNVALLASLMTRTYTSKQQMLDGSERESATRLHADT